MARPRRKPIEEETLVCLKLVRAVQPFCDSLKIVEADAHGNRKLTFLDTLTVLLAAFFNPTVRSLRLIEEFSQMEWAKGKIDVDRACRSTLSDALGCFDAEHLVPII